MAKKRHPKCGHLLPKNKNACHSCYIKNKKRTDSTFYLRTKYQVIMQRCRNKNHKEYESYKNYKVCSSEEFINKFKNDKQYLKLYKEWQKSNYKLSLTPSIDRIDNSKGYTLNNIQMITMGKNASKDNKTPVNVYNLKGKFIRSYSSMHEVSMDLKVNSGSIYKFLRGEYKKAGKYIFKYRK